MPIQTVSAEGRLRAKSQLTIPEPIVDAIGVREGDRFLIEVRPNEPDAIYLYRIRGSYAGALRDVYGDASDYLEKERGSWEPA
jgi:bifunctional DNA-binding transcriptional regulator/antitoxin component of YhaV-PrlF toxin-antitoxin module